jgi:hypothetical protein
MIHVIKLSSNIEGFLIIKYLSYLTFSYGGSNHTLAKAQRDVYRVIIKPCIYEEATRMDELIYFLLFI